MQKKRAVRFRALLLTLSVSVGLSAASLSRAEAPGVTADEIRIGSFGPLSGPNFLWGKMAMNGVDAVFDKVNASGGVHGRKLILVRQDDQCDPATTIAAVRRLIHNDGVFAIIGGACSNGVLAAKADIADAKIPFVNFAAASDAISAPPVANIFTTMLTSTLESRLQAKFVSERGMKRIAIVSQKDAWGRDRHAPLVAELERLGLKPVADEELNVNSTDATVQVLKIKAAQADAVILLLYPKPAAIFLRDAAKLAYKATFIGQSAIPDPVAFNEQVNTKGALDGFVTLSPVRYVPSDPEMAEWRERLGRLFPSDRLHSVNLYGVASAEIFIEALRRAGRDVTREKFLRELGALRDLTVPVYPGKIACTAGVSHQCHKSAAWVRLKSSTSIEIFSITTLN